ncbi:MAG: carboxymuconolactone decarboxylase family protein [Chloroflexi bacterium]|nr:carboxymuconolactone decarboxylase family protein [Chloroflexota bacterium]
MTKDELFAEVRRHLGTVPSWLEAMPQDQAQEVWTAVRHLLIEGVTLAPRDKALVCLAVGIAQGCQPLTALGLALVRAAGVPTPEMLEVRRVANAVAGMGRYFGAGGSFDYYRFEGDMLQMAAAMRTAMNIA